MSSNPFRRADSDKGVVIESNIALSNAAYVVAHNLGRLDSSVTEFAVIFARYDDAQNDKLRWKTETLPKIVIPSVEWGYIVKPYLVTEGSRRHRLRLPAKPPYRSTMSLWVTTPLWLSFF